MSESMAQHAVSRDQTRIFVLVFLMLCALTGVSFWIANSALMNRHLLGWGAMIAVSVAKATLVGLFFMHLWWERAWKYVLTLPAMILGTVLVLLLIPDIGLRTRTYSQERQRHAPDVELRGPAVGSAGDVSSLGTREALESGAASPIIE